jgi:hypothetical protein
MEKIDVSKRIEFLTFKRNMKVNREKLGKSFHYVNTLFGIEGDEYIKKFDWLCEEMEKVYVDWLECKLKLNELDYKCEKLKMDFIVENNIDIKERIENLKNRDNILNELYLNGFINSEMNDVLKEYFWKNRSGRMEYKFSGDR